MQPALVEASWEQLFQRINVQVPHAKVFDLRVREGAVVNCRVQPTILLTREEVRKGRSAPLQWNAQWRQLRANCTELWDGIMPEVTFRDGSPQVILPETFDWEFLSMAADDSPPDLRRMAVAA